MTVSSHKSFPKSNVIAVIVSITCILAFICCAFLTGIRYETKKFKALLTTLTLVFIYQIFFADVILMFVKAAIYTQRLIVPWSGEVNPAFVGGHNRKEYLKRRIAALKCQLELGSTFYKRNEAMTQKYKEILDDFCIFGVLLFLLLVLIIGSRDPLAYYNTRTIKDVLRNPKFSHSSIRNIITDDDLYDFINGTIVGGFNDGTSYNGKPFEESGWMDLQIAKVLGVIRLRQIRHTSLQGGSKYDTESYGPGWVKELHSLPYKAKFWRIFQPWEYQDNIRTGGVDRSGKVRHQPGGGYVALLGRNMVNSHRVLEFLHENHWIDGYTAVVVIEFTLYNVDADLFTLVMISAEQTGFNSFVLTDKIETLKLLVNIDNLPWYVLLTFVWYFTVLASVIANVVLKMWYSPSAKHYFSMSWNYVDILIVLLNVCIAIGVWIREVYVKQLLLQLETSKKNEFVPFYRAALIDEVCTTFIAFLVALATLRLWKILQFAKVFRLLTTTLHHAKRPLTSTTIFIVIFISGIAFGSLIINGSNSPSFAEFMKSITTLMSLSFGFGASVSPSDMNYGGNVIGFILYTILVAAVTIFLLNMFVTVVCLHFSQEKEDALDASHDDYTFWHFLVAELSEKCHSWVCKRKKTLANSGDDVLRLRGGGGIFGKPKDVNINVDDQVRRMELISEILDTQMELIRETIHVRPKEKTDDEAVEREDVSNEETEKPSTSSKNRNLPVQKKSRTFADVRRRGSTTTTIRSV